MKLVTLDLWTLTTGYRVLAFAGMGAVLLTCSLMYHRFRDPILSRPAT